jgi:hypothetical protein
MSTVGQVGSHLASISTKAERSRLDAQPHFIPINLKVLEITLGRVIVQDVEKIYDAETIAAAKENNVDLATDSVISLAELKNSIENYISNRHKNRIDISGSSLKVNGTVKESLDDILDNYLPATVYSNGQIVGALYKSYDAAYSGLFKDFLNKEINKFLDKVVYKGTGYKIGFDVGHILGKSELAKTPLGEKLKRILSVIDSLSDNTLNIPGITSQYISGNKKDIAAFKSKVDSLFKKLAKGSSYGPKIEAEIKKDFGLNKLLVSLKANVVIVQDRYENQAVYAKLLEGPLGKQLIDLLQEVTFSNNIKQQIAENIALTIARKSVVSTKKTVSIKKSVPKKSVNSTLVKEAKKVISVKNLPKYRTKPTALTLNLTNLQNLVNASLVERVKANMGRGERRDVLNLRTGRFAESVKVERMTESRQGMITAFYSYMKNPYATFSQGGAQDTPKSRDPKLLIAKSIREIATQQVANRLRSVSV